MPAGQRAYGTCPQIADLALAKTQTGRILGWPAACSMVWPHEPRRHGVQPVGVVVPGRPGQAAGDLRSGEAPAFVVGPVTSIAACAPGCRCLGSVGMARLPWVWLGPTGVLVLRGNPGQRAARPRALAVEVVWPDARSASLGVAE
jgi:hypothetical protein